MNAARLHVLAPTNTQGKRIVFTLLSLRCVYPWDYSTNFDGNCHLAVRMVITYHGSRLPYDWSHVRLSDPTSYILAELPNGDRTIVPAPEKD